MDLHGKIMNIQVESAKIGGAVEASMKLDNDFESRLALSYKIGHRDARHAAAELAALPPEPRTCETCGWFKYRAMPHMKTKIMRCTNEEPRDCETGIFQLWTPRSPQSADVETVRESLKRAIAAGKAGITDGYAMRSYGEALAALDRIAGKEE